HVVEAQSERIEKLLDLRLHDQTREARNDDRCHHAIRLEERRGLREIRDLARPPDIAERRKDRALHDGAQEDVRTEGGRLRLQLGEDRLAGDPHPPLPHGVLLTPDVQSLPRFPIEPEDVRRARKYADLTVVSRRLQLTGTLRQALLLQRALE